MFIRKVRTSGFRNLVDVSLEFDSHITFLIGKNGQGKTNFVEALYVLSKGKSFRTSRKDHLISFNSSSATVETFFTHDDLDFEAAVNLTVENRRFFLNGKPSTAFKIFKKLPLIFFSPESLTAIKGGPENRRDLLDETSLIESESNLQTHSRFKNVLKTRNRILKDAQSGRISTRQSDEMLDSVDLLYAPLCLEVTQMRQRLIQALNPFVQEAIREILNQPTVEISVDYDSGSLADDLDPTKLARKLIDSRQHDVRIGYSQVGPQKHDVVFLFGQKDSRFFSSQGQQRALILAFKFGQIMYHREIYGFYPILILDDVLSELDREKKNFLINFLKRSEVQAFITATELDFSGWSQLQFSAFEVDHGTVKRS